MRTLLWYGGNEMARCKDCGIIGRNNKPLCWAKYGLCLQCCVKKHPHEYPLNIVEKALKNQGIKKSTRVIRICQNCGKNIRKLGFFADQSHKMIDAGYCTVCAEITVYDPRLKIQEVTV